MNLKVKLITLKRGLLAKLQAAGLSAGEPAVIWDDTSKPRMAVGDRDGVPREVVGAAHAHATSEVTGLDTALAGKASAAHLHSWNSVTDKPATFTPPIASASAIGGIKVGGGLVVAADGTLSLEPVSYSNLTNIPTSFTPSSHNHAITDVTSLRTELDGLKPIGIDKIRIYLAAAANSSTGGWQKVPMDTVVFDTNNLWDNTNKRVVPKKEGYYQVNMRVRRNSSGGMVAGVALNSSAVAVTYVGTDAGTVYASGGSALVYCNGTTDYIEPYIWAITSYDYTNVDRETWFEAFGPI